VALRRALVEREAGRVADHVVVRQHPRRGRSDRAERRDRLVDDGAQLGGVPVTREIREVERLVHLVGAHPLRDLGDGRHPGLAAEHPVALVLGENPVPVAVDVVHALLSPVGNGLGAAHRVRVGGRGVVGQAVGLHEAVRHVDAEPVDAAVEPEAQDSAELLAHLLVRPVEVGLRRVEEMQVPLAVGHAGPRGAAEDRLPVVGRQLARLTAAIAEHVAGTLGGSRCGRERGLEPGVLVRRVVGHEVRDDPEAQLVSAAQHRVEVVERAEEGIHVAIVGDVVARVLLRAGHEGGQPDDVDAEAREAVQSVGDPREVADAITGGIGE
jgi:hypothetical protein